MSKLRDTSTGIGTTPASMPTFSNPRPAPPKVATPRDSGMLSDGSTAGNFQMSGPGGMLNVGINAGPQGTQDVADSVSESFASPKSSMP